MTQYTVVQHSGFGYADKPGFEHGLEPRRITAREARAVERAGGLVFEGYREADDFCEAAMYPEGAGLLPAARGTFAELRVDELRVYIPVREVVG